MGLGDLRGSKSQPVSRKPRRATPKKQTTKIGTYVTSSTAGDGDFSKMPNDYDTVRDIARQKFTTDIMGLSGLKKTAGIKTRQVASPDDVEEKMAESPIPPMREEPEPDPIVEAYKEPKLNITEIVDQEGEPDLGYSDTQSIWGDDNNPDSTVDMYKELISKYGGDWINWEPETIWEMIYRDYGDDPSQLSKDRIMASILVTKNDMPFTEWHVFQKAALSFSGTIPRFDANQDLSVGEAGRGIHIMRQIRDHSFSEEIRQYLASIAFLNGFVYLPEPLSFVQAALDKQSTDDEFRKEVEENWVSVRGKDPEGISFEESPVSIQMAKMFAVREYAINGE